MKKIEKIIETCDDCDFYILYSEFHNLINPINHLISVCAKGNFIINNYKKLDEIDSIARKIPENCPLETYKNLEQ